MKVLFVSDCICDIDNGAKVGSVSHASALNALDIECHLVALTRTEISSKDKLFLSRFKKYSVIKSFNNRLEHYVNIISLNGWSMNRRVVDEIVKLIVNEKYDVLFIDNSILGKIVREAKKKIPDIKIITFYIDIRAVLAKKWIKTGGLRSVPFNIGQIINEKIAQYYSDYNLVLNERDSRLYEKVYGKKPEFKLPTCIEDRCAEAYLSEKHRLIEKDEIKIMFVGAYYDPNVKGVQWFIKNVFRGLENKYMLKIVGSGMEKLKEELDEKDIQDNRIVCKGYVDSIEEEYYDADILVMPIFDGGGMKIKTAEAMSFGKCILSTDEALLGYEENIPVEVMNNLIFRCNNAVEFKNSIKKLESDESVCVCNEAVRNIYLSNYSYDSMQRRLSAILNKCQNEK